MSKTIPLTLTQGYEALVDDEDYERVSQFKWSALPLKNTCYAIRREWPSNKGILMHRFIMDAPPDVEVDHENNDGLINVRSNLRLATKSENMQNQRRRSDNRSGYKGVGWSKDHRCWRARIMVDEHRVHLGYFADPVEAALAYDAAAHKYFGEFAKCNFKEGITNVR